MIGLYYLSLPNVYTMPFYKNATLISVGEKLFGTALHAKCSYKTLR